MKTRMELCNNFQDTEEFKQEIERNFKLKDTTFMLDEIGYEGNIAYGWGNISGEEMTRRFWEAYTRGGYATHGETYMHPEDILWWSHGGRLHGSSPERIAFLKNIMEEAPARGIEPAPSLFDETVIKERGALLESNYFIYYFGANRPSEREFRLPENKTYRAQLIDTWNMTIEEYGEVTGRFTLEMPGTPYIAVRFIAVD